MASRREFLQMGLAASAVPFSTVVFGWDGEPAPTAPYPFYKVVFDERFPASRAFAGEVERLGLLTHGIKGDVTALWFHDLDARWKQEPAAIAGLTSEGALFCLEILARDHGMRVLFRADHQLDRANARLEHALTGPTSLLQEAVDLRGLAANWGRQVAHMVTRFPRGRTPVSSLTVVTPVAEATEDPAYLVSWVIAPSGRQRKAARTFTPRVVRG